MGIRSTHTTRNLNSRKASVPTIAKGKPLDARGSEGDLTFRRTSEGLKLYIKANHKWHGIKVGESFDSLEKRINEMKSKVDTIKQFRLPSTYSVTGDFTLDVSGDIELNADGGQVTIKDDTASHFLFDCDNTTLTIYDDADAADYFKIVVDANGATTLESIDGGASSADIKIHADGDNWIFAHEQLKLDARNTAEAAGGDIMFLKGGTQFGYLFGATGATSDLRLFERGGTTDDDFLQIRVAEHGATDISTVDAAAAAANLTMTIDGAITLDAAQAISIDMTDRLFFKNAGTTFASIQVDTVSQFTLFEQGGASTDDFFQISTATHGATTIKTLDVATGLGEGHGADLHIDVDGDITYEANGTVSAGSHIFRSGSLQFAGITGTAAAGILNIYNPADTNDYFRITTGNHGATTISTLDNAIGAHNADITLDPLGELILTPDVEVKSDAPLKIKEAANAVADTAAYGQLWVKNEAPCELYFTTDAGDDIQLTDGTSAAGGGGGTNNYLIQAGGLFGRCQYNNWYSNHTTYGPAYYYWYVSTGGTSLPSTHADGYNPGWVVPVNSTVKSFGMYGNCRSTDTIEFAIMKGTVTYGSAGDYSMSQIGATQSAGGTANILYKWEQTGLSVSVNAGDIIKPYFRRTTDNDATYVYIETAINVFLEVA